MDKEFDGTLMSYSSFNAPTKSAHAIRRISPEVKSLTPNEIKMEDPLGIDEVRRYVNSASPSDHPGNPCTIFKVPKHIRRLDPQAYDPLVASFGPFHHVNPYSTSFMHAHKWPCVRHLLSRHRSEESASQLLDECLLELKKQDAMVRSCYSEELPSWLDDQNLALIMLRDGRFIIYLMLKECAKKEALKEETKREKGMEEEMEEEEEEIVGKLEVETTKEDEGKKRRESMIDIGEGEGVLQIEEEEEEQLEGPTVAGLFTFDLVVYDLLKLENQIPFFIIKSLFDQLKPCEDEKIDLIDLALQLFKGIHPEESESFKKKEKKSPDEYHHLLHLFYSSRIPSKKPECMKSKWKKVESTALQGSTQVTQTSPTELDMAGVKFKKKKLSTDSFLNITFERRKMEITPLLCLLKLCLIFRSGWMEIPPLQIYDYTGPLFQNLIAFEQCYLDSEMYFTTYALFMDCIIDKAEDVRLLHLEGILEHKLSSDQAVAEFFNKLGCHTYFTLEKNYLTNQIKKVNKVYCWIEVRLSWQPMAIILVLASIFLVLLTIKQAVFSALSYFHSS